MNRLAQSIRGVVKGLPVIFAVFAIACLSEDAPPPPNPTVCPPAVQGEPVAPELMAFLSRARSAHHAADLHEENGRIEQAIRTLRDVTSAPKFETPPTEVREVLADTHARIADLESRREQFEAAETSIQRGLELARETTYFRGHLYEVRGLVFERQAKKYQKEGNGDAAKASTEKALSAFEESMKIQSQVIQQAVGDGGTP